MAGGIARQTGASWPVRSLFALLRERCGIGIPWTGSWPQWPSVRAIVVLAASGAIVTLACCAAGYELARHSDAQRVTAQHETLREAIAEYRALFGASHDIDPRFVRMIEKSAAVKGLKFETEPYSERETQPVLDARGRIAGFFTFDAEQSATRAVIRLMPVIVLMAAGMVILATLVLARLRTAERERDESREEARRADEEDKLTGLPSHSKLLDLLDLALAERSREAVTTFALIELDGMADIVNQFGVLGGDELIVSVAQRLKEVLPPDTVIGRIGSDKFAAVFTATREGDAEAALRGAIDAVTRPHWIDAVVRIGARAGYAQAPRHATTRGALIHRADIALRKAGQKSPSAIVVYEQAIDSVSSEQQFIRRDLPRALSARELELHYQPIVAAQGGRIVGVEALLRWNHASRGQIPPATFIPVAEQMGLMDTLGAFVLRRALDEAKRWPDLYIAVNLSPLQLRDRDIVELTHAALRETGVEPSRLMLEVTESVLIDNPDEVLERIEALRELGVRIALDDFGSGYSNLGYLQRFPFDKLKIDRGFVSVLGRSSNGGVIIQAIVALGRALGVSVLAEGVETEEQRVLLRLAGCDEMQGFLFAKPAPGKVIDRLIKRPKSRRRPKEARLSA